MSLPHRFCGLTLAGSIVMVAAAGTASAQLTVDYDFAPNYIIPDNGQYSETKTLGGLSSFSNVTVRLSLDAPNAADPMYLGDLYSTLTVGTAADKSAGNNRVAVLLNRVGRDDTNEFGSSLDALNVTLADSGATNIFNTTSSTGTYQPDGRGASNPYGAAAPFASGTSNLGALIGPAPASNKFTLLVADTSQGGTARLTGWGMTVTGTAAASGTLAAGAGGTFSISDGAGTVNTLGASVDTTGGVGGVLSVTLAGTSTFSGGVTGTGGLAKSGAGTLILSAAGTYTGGTAVNAGTLLVTNASGSGTGTGAVTVNNSGSLLGGTGAISGGVTVGSGAAITGGTRGSGGVVAAGDVGTLHVGALTLTGSSIVHIDVAGPGSYDSVVSSGAVTLGSAAVLELNIASGLTFAPGDRLTLIDSSSAISGTFAGIDQGAPVSAGGYLFTADYLTGNDFSLVAVPEPATLMGGILLVAAFGFGARRRLAGMRARGVALSA